MKKFGVNWNLCGKLNWLLVILFSTFLFFGSKLSVQAQGISISKFTIAATIQSDTTSVQAYIVDQHPELMLHNSHIKFAFNKQTAHANYYTYYQFYNNIKIADAFIKICVAKNGAVQYLVGNYHNTAAWRNLASMQINSIVDNLIKSKFLFPESLLPKQVIRVAENQAPQITFVYDYQFTNDRSRLTIFCDADGNIVETDNHKVYFSGVDTSVAAKVFLPDPLTTAEINYGGDYSDNDDADNEALNNESVPVTIKVKLENDTFFLRTDSLILKDLNAPTVPIVTSIIPEFNYLRSESGFEDVNVFYHITNMNQELINLGYENLQNFYIEIDPHGASGGDVSFYVSAVIPSIQFGEGGVDDAEDADVIIHEYSHAISDQASPLSNSGLERRALDEGYGDYFAASYSRKFSDYGWAKIFSWDGHNEFWFGRNADTDKHYPEDNSDNYYAASEIWSGALMDIFDLIGKENTDKLALEALHGSFPNMTMPQAALLIVEAEALLFGGTYNELVYGALQARGLLYPVAINDKIISDGITFTNTAGFSFDNESLIINFKTAQSYQLNCYSINGNLIASLTGTSSIIEWQSLQSYPEILILEIITETSKASTVLVKMN